MSEDVFNMPSEKVSETISWGDYEKAPIISAGDHVMRLVSYLKSVIGGSGAWAQVEKVQLRVLVRNEEDVDAGLFGDVTFLLGDDKDPKGEKSAAQKRRKSMFELRNVLTAFEVPLLGGHDDIAAAVKAGEYYARAAVLIKQKAARFNAAGELIRDATEENVFRNWRRLSSTPGGRSGADL